MRRPVATPRDDPSRPAQQGTPDGAEAARARRRERIRAQSRAVADYLRSSPEGRAFYEDWGTPTAELER